MHNTVGGEYNVTPPVLTDKQLARLQQDLNGNLMVAIQDAIGGLITWTRSNPTLDGSSDTILAANAARKGLIIANPIGNAQVSVDIAGGTVTLANGIPLMPGDTITITGSECPVGIITGIGTNTQKVVVYEGA